MKVYHPDKNKTINPEIFLKIQKAYEILKDKYLRRTYDEFLEKKLQKKNKIISVINEKDKRRKEFAEKLLKKEKEFAENKDVRMKTEKIPFFYSFKPKNTFDKFEQKNIDKMKDNRRYD